MKKIIAIGIVKNHLETSVHNNSKITNITIKIINNKEIVMDDPILSTVIPFLSILYLGSMIITAFIFVPIVDV